MRQWTGKLHCFTAGTAPALQQSSTIGTVEAWNCSKLLQMNMLTANFRNVFFPFFSCPDLVAMSLTWLALSKRQSHYAMLVTTTEQLLWRHSGRKPQKELHQLLEPR